MSEKTEYEERNLKVDVTKIGGKGVFSCPYCGNRISPNDESNKKYKIVDTKYKNDDVEEVILGCNKCNSKIELVGFVTLQ